MPGFVDVNEPRRASDVLPRLDILSKLDCLSTKNGYELMKNHEKEATAYLMGVLGSHLVVSAPSL